MSNKEYYGEDNLLVVYNEDVVTIYYYPPGELHLVFAQCCAEPLLAAEE